MQLLKGNIIKQIKRNEDPDFANTTANGELTYKVVRVNPKTYGLECIDGYMKGTRCNISKDFKEEHTDIYGTITKWVLVE